MIDKELQEEVLRLKQLIQQQPREGKKVSGAPPPITPLSGYGVTYSRPQKIEPQKEHFVPITGTELMQKWSVGWQAIFDLARQNALTPDKPKRWKDCIDYDSGMLSFQYSQQEREEYFSQWLYHPIDAEAFEKQHGKIIDEWRRKLVCKEDKPQHDTASIPAAAPVKPKSSYFSKIGEKGGGAEKGNKSILIAVTEYIKEKKCHAWSNDRIARAFCNKYNENSPKDVIFNEIEWEVYCKANEIISDASEAYSKKFNKVRKSIKYTTFLNNYIPKAKEAVLSDNSK
ncbi:MAG: hypothetical protein Q7U03_02255 [Syntrophales bacterium]|nr:hypothetical protein [Syntrophales bacterium]